MSRIVPHCPDLVSYLAVVSERPREVAPVLAWSRATVIPAPSFVARPRRVRRALAAFFKSAARLVGSLALIGFGLLLIWFHVVWLWHPEAVLMRHYAIAPNVTGTHDTLLLMLGLGVSVVLVGCGCFADWKNSLARWWREGGP